MKKKNIVLDLERVVPLADLLKLKPLVKIVSEDKFNPEYLIMVTCEGTCRISKVDYDKIVKGKRSGTH